jgi:hypothetical protein
VPPALWKVEFSLPIPQRVALENQNVTNYPIAGLTNLLNGNVYYARTYNWSSTGVQTGHEIVSTEMSLPAGLPHGIYLLSIRANGISSLPWLFFH